jgi:hypothetical protein
MEAFNKPCFTIVVARTGCGKTHAIRWIVSNLYNQGKIKGAIAFASTAKVSGDYNFLAENRVYDRLNPAVIESILAHRAILKRDGKEIPPLAIILDDIVGDQEVRSTWLNDLASKSRHYNIYLFVIVQAAKVISPTLRTNAGLVILFTQTSKEMLEASYSLVDFPSKKEFTDFMRENVTGYKWLLYNKMNPADNLNDKYSIVIAPAKQPSTKIP